MPPPRNLFFTGREQTLSRLVQAFQAYRQVALSGLGGLGKTQTAVEYAYRHREVYQAILWANAETVEALTSSFGALCHVLRLPERTAADQGLAVAAITRWLSHSSDWLLILDNAEDLSILRPLIPSDPQGRVLVTTRARATGTIERLDMEKMAPKEGVLFLLRRARCLAREASLDHASAVDYQAALAIVEELDGLPLAIDQAGAYIEETPWTLGEYLDLYKAEGKALRAARGELAPDHTSVSVTFSLAFKQVAERSQAAADLILACACLAPDAIPEEIFIEGAAALGEVLGGAMTSLAQFAKLVREATRYSLIERQPTQRTLEIHRVVQGVLKDEMEDVAYRQWTERVVRALDTVFPYVEVTTWGRCERLLPHAQACVDHIARCGFLFPEAARLLNRIGHYLHERARYAEAEQPYGRALAIREQALGPEHPDVARSLNHLAALYEAQGQYGKAEPLYRRALAIWEQALGPEHPGVAASLENYASLLRKTERDAEAVPLESRAEAIRAKHAQDDTSR